MKKHILTACLLGSLPLGAQAADITAENLKSLLETRNARVEAARLETEAAAERGGFFARSFWPEIELYGQQETFKKGRRDQLSQPAYGAQAVMNLFNGGRDRLRSDGLTLQTEKKAFQFQRVRAEELEKARTLYWSLLYGRERLALLEDSVKVNNGNLKAAERRIRSGVATESDRAEFEMKAVELDQALAEARLHRTTQLRQLALLLGFEEPDELNVQGQLEHEHEYETALAHSMKDHEFLYKEHEIQSEAADLEARGQSRSWVPRLDAFAAYNQYNQREEEDYPDAADRTESTVGLRLSISLGEVFSGGRESGALRKEALSARALAEMQKKEIEVHIHNEMAELQLLHDQVHAAEQNTRRAETYYRLTQSEYARGVKNSPDVLGAAEKLYDAKNRHLEIIRDFQIAKAHVLSKIGK